MINLKDRQQGSSLIEVLVALFILAVGLLGVLAMQSRAVQLNQNAYLYSQAAVLANDVMEAMRTSPTSLGTYNINYGDPSPNSPACATAAAGCSSESDIALWNVSQWRNNIENLLPGGQGEIARVGNDIFIRVRFQIGYNELTNQAINDEVVMVSGQ